MGYSFRLSKLIRLFFFECNLLSQNVLLMFACMNEQRRRLLGRAYTRIYVSMCEVHNILELEDSDLEKADRHSRYRCLLRHSGRRCRKGPAGDREERGRSRFQRPRERAPRPAQYLDQGLPRSLLECEIPQRRLGGLRHLGCRQSRLRLRPDHRDPLREALLLQPQQRALRMQRGHHRMLQPRRADPRRPGSLLHRLWPLPHGRLQTHRAQELHVHLPR